MGNTLSGNAVVSIIVAVLGVAYFLFFFKKQAGKLHDRKEKILDFITQFVFFGIGVFFLYAIPTSPNANIFEKVAFVAGVDLNFAIAAITAQIVNGYLMVKKQSSDAETDLAGNTEKKLSEDEEKIHKDNLGIFIGFAFFWFFLMFLFGGNTGIGIWITGTIFGLIMFSLSDTESYQAVIRKDLQKAVLKEQQKAKS